MANTHSKSDEDFIGIKGTIKLPIELRDELKNPLGVIRNALYYIKTSLDNTPLLESDPQLKKILSALSAHISPLISPFYSDIKVTTWNFRDTRILNLGVKSSFDLG